MNIDLLDQDSWLILIIYVFEKACEGPCQTDSSCDTGLRCTKDSSLRFLGDFFSRNLEGESPDPSNNPSETPSDAPSDVPSDVPSGE